MALKFAASYKKMDESVPASLFAHVDDIEPPAPPPSFHSYKRSNLRKHAEPSSLNVKLVGKHVLWSHCLWNAGIALARYIEDNISDEIEGKRVLELGAGAGLPSLVCSLLNAELTVMTEYPDEELVQNTRDNINLNLPSGLASCVHARGYRWGDKDLGDLLTLTGPKGSQGYDIIILADLIFNHSQHEALLWTADAVRVKDKPCVMYCVFSHHRPSKADKDMHFFELARENGWQVTFLMTQTHQPMFEKDYGDPLVRSQVHFYKLSK